MEKQYVIKSYILDMTIEMWDKFHAICEDHQFVGTAAEFLDTIGLPSGLSARFNQEEKQFFDEIYQLDNQANPIQGT